MHRQLDKAKRRAAGRVLLMMFGLSNTIGYTLSQLAVLHHDDGLGEGLTEKERELTRKLATRMYADGAVYRKLGWRLLGKNH